MSIVGRGITRPSEIEPILSPDPETTIRIAETR
jgi:hypothetical protein